MTRAFAVRASRRGRSGVLLALVALAVQLATASIVLPAAAPSVAMDRLVAASICHPGKAPAHRPSPACAVCPLCQAVAQAGVLLASSPIALAAPAVSVWRPALPPPARAPPGHAPTDHYARGPPRLT